MDSRLPDLTVALIAGPAPADRALAAACLESLLAQDLAGGQLEILLLDRQGREASEPQGPAAETRPGADRPDRRPLVGGEHPAVRCVPIDPGKTHEPHALRARGAMLARAPIVAFVEDHTRVRPGWARAILAAHAGPWAGVGWSIVCGNPDQRWAQGLGFLTYGLWAAPAPAGEASLLWIPNASFKAAALRAYGDGLADLLAQDVAGCERLRRDGHRLAVAPDAIMEHLDPTSPRLALGALFEHHRRAAAQRARAGAWGWARRMAHVLGAPLRPFYALAGDLHRARRAKALGAAGRLGFLGRQAPLLLLGHACAAAGAVAGLLAPPGRPASPAAFPRGRPRGRVGEPDPGG